MHYNPNSPVWQFVSLCLRYFILNLFFLISIIPIVTIGPARAAMYSTVFAFSDNDDINLGREYIRRFKREFKRGIGSSIIFVVLIAAIVFAIVFWNALDTNAAYITLPILIIFGVLTFLTFEYYYPLQARYENTFRQTLQLLHDALGLFRIHARHPRHRRGRGCDLRIHAVSAIPIHPARLRMAGLC